MEHKKVLVIKDYHNNTDQESQQAHSAKHRKLLSELWKQKNKLEAIYKTNTNIKPLFRGYPQEQSKCPLKRGSPWLEVGLGFVNKKKQQRQHKKNHQNFYMKQHVL